ncbi:MAG TPA: hypothetical protein VKT20_07960 [Candidatus Dormibacteraeota bacterium]|nr:hypothetical protein [Candidatus Dormibacteraeota bacterium]
MISTIATPRRIRLAGFAAGAVAVAAAAVYVTASAAGYNFSFNRSSTPPAQAGLTTAPLDKSGTASAVCTDFVSHFASDLGTSQSKVDSAFQQAAGQTLADEVKNGTITQAQADAIKARLNGKEPCSLAAGLGAPKPAATQHMQQLLAAAASALGITPQTLRTDLMNGQTLSQIAAAQNPPVTEDQFRTKLIANLKPLLDQAVTDGKLTSAQEQQILTLLQTGPIPFWDKPMKRAGAGA